MPESPLSPKLFRFLRELKKNNNRDWFAENKPRYENDVRGPAVELVTRLEKPLMKAAPMLCVVPKGHGGSVMRIYRDTRFGKDKTPYKTNVGISIRHQADKNIHAPGVYLHLEPGDCFIGAGSWRPASPQLAAFRNAIAQDSKAWIKARDQKAFRETFSLAGEKLKTSPRAFDKDHPMIEDLRRIDFIAIAPLAEKELCGPDAVAIIIDRIKKAKPMLSFLCDAIGVPY
ncbi:hypothetical protein Poly51_08040 [Rubripirellula tenax]|uniref:TIGR02453 family protein n=1 Tax=Rubripirellula tenax TaxID=2528015 RepID=A0A5C6FGG0_9BACT|nr:DUF2461 domain-containing protein [Rubripirellula tenax]TWU60528.1 hypothetical protein Poly51_08040 [Rubripirellula tenax]